MGNAKWLAKAALFWEANSAEILLGGSIAGVIFTAIASGNAALKADDIIAEAEYEFVEEANVSMEDFEGFTFLEKVKLTWPCYILPVLLGGATIACFIGSHNIQGKKLAALASAYSITDSAYKEYREKVQSKFGKKKAEEVQHEIDSDKMAECTMLDNDILSTNHGDVLCLDAWSGQKFFSNAEAIRQAKDTVNCIMTHDLYVSLNSFYDELGIPPTEAGDDTGWNALADESIRVTFTSTLDKEKIPCLVMHIHPSPRPLYKEI